MARFQQAGMLPSNYAILNGKANVYCGVPDNLILLANQPLAPFRSNV